MVILGNVIKYTFCIQNVQYSKMLNIGKGHNFAHLDAADL